MKNQSTPIPGAAAPAVGTCYRQGDVLIRRIDPVPDADRSKLKPVARERGRIVLAHGEVTGHAHAIPARGAKLFTREEAGGATILEISQALADLQHEEHATIPLRRGTYEIRRQREYHPEEIRRVAD